MPQPLGNMFPYATETLLYVITESVYILPHSFNPVFIYMAAVPRVVMAFIMETVCFCIESRENVKSSINSRTI